ncbi:MAG: addiction module antidote protein [Sphingomonadaceae bacterium]
MTLKLTQWNSADYLRSKEDIVLYFNAVIEEAGDDVAFIAKALGNIARAYGMTQLANETGLGRESLYKALSEGGNPSLATILKVVRALGLRFQVEVLGNSPDFA